MEQENKYYTPDISELYVGYECQIGNTGYAEDFEGVNWRNIVLGKRDEENSSSYPYYDLFADIADSLFQIRTKYLDQSDIESCGWENCRKLTDWFGKNDKLNQVAFDKENMMLGYDYDTHILVIAVKDPTKSEDGKTEVFDYPRNAKWFRGECKSINELRTIMKFLKITEDGKS